MSDLPDDWFRPGRPSADEQPMRGSHQDERYTDQFKPGHASPVPPPSTTARPEPTAPVFVPDSASTPSSHSIGRPPVDDVIDDPDPRGRTRQVLPILALVVSMLIIGLAVGRRWGQPSVDQGREDSTAGLVSLSPSPSPAQETPGPWLGPVSTIAASSVVSSCTAPAQPGYDGRQVPSDAERILDGDRTTGWRCDGDAKDETLTFSFPEGTRIVGVRLTNGYTKRVDGMDLYPQYRRLERAQWSFPAGASAWFVQDFEDDEQEPQEIRIPESGTDGGLRMRVEETTSPGRSSISRDALILTEVEFLVRS